MPESEQILCFMAGANAVFTGEQMLTTPCELDRFYSVTDVAHILVFQAHRGMR